MKILEIIKDFIKDNKKQKEYYLAKLACEMSPFELVEIIKNNINEYNLIDVRDYDEYIDGHIPFAIHIPLDSFLDHTNMLEKDKINIIYCQSDYCIKATTAAIMATEAGYKVRTLIGGFYGWKKMKYEIIKNSK